MATSKATRSAPWRAIARMGHVEEAVGVQAHPGQPVVAALVFGVSLGQGGGLDPVDTTNGAFQRLAGEVIGTQPAATPGQRGQMIGLTDAER